MFVRFNIILHHSLAGQYDIADAHDNVAIVFCDICKFDSIVQAVNENIVFLLDQLFRAFD